MPVTLPPLVWRESPNTSRRLQPVRLIVVHRAVAAYASAVRTCCDPDAEVSYHVVVNERGDEATQLVPWAAKSWSCAAFNSASDNICTPDWVWTSDTTEARRVRQVCARVVAFRCHKRNAPAEWIRAGGLVNLTGVTRHYDLGKAGGGHTDPTTDRARWLAFMGHVAEELARGGFRPVWGR